MVNVIIFILSLTLIIAEKSIGEKPKSIFWGLIKLNPDSKFFNGYYYSFFFKAREFSEPVSYIPIEIRYGFGFNGKLPESGSEISTESEDSWLWFNQGVEADLLDIKIENSVGLSLDIDLGMINIPNLLLKTSYLNILTGINYRTSSILSPKTIPSNWIENTSLSGKDIAFSPKLNEYLLTNVLQWQPYQSWYINLRYGYGLASSKFYFDNSTETYLTEIRGTGSSMATAIGFRYIIDSGKQNRFSIGLDLRHSYTKINKINDPNNISPINRFDLANYGIYLTLSPLYGGKKTIGDQAKQTFFKKDYINSKKEFKEFIYNHPGHARRYKAQEYIEKCNFRIPYQIMNQGIAYDDIGDLENALDKYLLAKSLIVKNDSILIKSLDFRIDEIARSWVNKAEILLENEYYNQAYTEVKKIAEFSNVGVNELKRFKSYVIFGEGKNLQSILIFGRAMEKYSEALKLNPSLEFKIKALQYSSGINLVKLAEQIDKFEEIELAIYALETAKEYSGSIGLKNEKLLNKLIKKLELYDNYKKKLNIENRMQVARKKQALARSEKLKLGMMLPRVENLLGQPHEIISKKDRGSDYQLWLYFIKDGTLELSFKNYELYKINKN